MSRRVRFGLALTLLLAWHVPAFAAIGVGLHLAGDDHGPAARAAELALAATHGHHHELDAAGHDHPAVRVAPPVAPAATAVAQIVASSIVVESLSSSRSVGDAPPPRAGPPQLFYLHCALLL